MHCHICNYWTAEKGCEHYAPEKTDSVNVSTMFRWADLRFVVHQPEELPQGIMPFYDIKVITETVGTYVPAYPSSVPLHYFMGRIFEEVDTPTGPEYSYYYEDQIFSRDLRTIYSLIWADMEQASIFPNPFK